MPQACHNDQLVVQGVSPTSRTARRASRLLSGDVRVCHPRGCLIDLLHRRADAIGRFEVPPYHDMGL